MYSTISTHLIMKRNQYTELKKQFFEHLNEMDFSLVINEYCHDKEFKYSKKIPKRWVAIIWRMVYHYTIILNGLKIPCKKIKA